MRPKVTHNMRGLFTTICNETSSAMPRRHHRRKTERSRVQLHTCSWQCEQWLLFPAARSMLTRTASVHHSYIFLPPSVCPEKHFGASGFCLKAVRGDPFFSNAIPRCARLPHTTRTKRAPKPGLPPDAACIEAAKSRPRRSLPACLAR